MQAVIYARVSRDDGTQNVANQLEPLTEWAKRLGATVVAIEVDRASGKRGNARPGLDRVRQLAHERRFDALLIAALDRLSRGGIETTAQLLRELDERGVAIQSLREPWLYQADPNIRGLLISIFAWIAETERTQLVARTKAGMRRAERAGKHIGRPASPVDADQCRRAYAKTGSVRKAAALLGVSPSVVQSRLVAVG